MIDSNALQRVDYFDENISQSNINSATALRNELRDNHEITTFIPNYEYKFYNPTILDNNLYKLLQFKLINDIDFNNIKGVSEGIENRLINFINCECYNDFINNVKSKRYTVNKIKRLILYILK